MTLAQKLSEPQFDGLPDWQVAEMLNAPDTAHGTRRMEVSPLIARRALQRRGEWVPLLHARTNTTLPDVIRTIASEIVEVLSPAETAAIDMTDDVVFARVSAGLGALVANDILTAAARDTLMALAVCPCSWAEAHGTAVDARAVGLARGGI
jgi:hypothetical protein